VTLVDTNILLDLARNDPDWADWSVFQLSIAALSGAIVINPIVYAEFSVGYSRIEDMDAVLQDTAIEVVETPREALFLAGKVFQRYRQAGGVRTGVLSDFFIGAHAAVAGIALLTRDARPYRRYFPTVALITPPPPDFDR